MASVDVPIVRPTTEAAPKDYEIPAAQEIAPLAVHAEIDGSGAAGDFVPALQLLAPGGQVMWTAPTSETVAAGASAGVSWFPRVGKKAASAGAALITQQGGLVIDPTTTLDIDTGLTLVDLGGGEALIYADGPPALIYARCESKIGAGFPYFPAGPIPFTTDDSNGITVAADSWTVITAGLYQIEAVGQLQLYGPAVADLTGQPALSVGAVFTGMVTPPSGMFDWEFPVSIDAGQFWGISPTLSKMFLLPAGAVVTFQVGSGLVGTPHFTFGSWSMWRVGP